MQVDEIELNFSFPFFPVLPRRHVKPLSKHPVKCPQAAKPRAQRSVGYSFIRVLQKVQCCIQAQFVQVSVEVCVEGLRKDPGEGERAVSEILSHFCQRNILSKMSSHIGHCVVDNVMSGLLFPLAKHEKGTG